MVELDKSLNFEEKSSYEQTLENLLDIFPDKREIIEKFQEYITINRKVLKSKKFSTLFIHFLENNFLEKMSTGENKKQWFDFLYSRESEFASTDGSLTKKYKWGIELSNSEYNTQERVFNLTDWEDLISEIVSNNRWTKFWKKDVVIVTDIENDIINKDVDNNLFIVNYNIDIDNYRKLINFVKESDNEDILIVCNVKIWNNVSVFSNITKWAVTLWPSHKESKVFENANVNMPIEVVYREFLEAGVPLPLTPKWFDNLGNKIDVFDGNINFWKQVFDIIHSNVSIPPERRDKKIWRNVFNKGIDYNRVLDRHEEHYKKFLWKIGDNEPEMLFTQWWAAANNSVLYMLDKYVSDKWMWEELSFYFEHNVGWVIDKAEPKEKRVYLLSPSKLTPGKDIWKENDLQHYSNFLDKVEKVCSDSLVRPSEDFFLVIDLTTRLDIDLKDLLKDKPKNLHVIVTSSLTKHQRWLLKYFFWFVWIYSDNNDIKKDIEKYIEDKNSNLNEDNVSYLPRLRKSEIKNNLINISRNRNTFLKWLDEWYKDIPDRLKLHVENSDYFSFFYPDIRSLVEYKAWKNLEEILIRVPRFDEYKMYKWTVLDNSNEYSDPNIFKIVYGNTDLEHIDSFWLRNTVCCPFMRPWWYSLWGGFPYTKFIRISFWIKKNKEENYKLWKQMWEVYKKWLIDNWYLKV